ncbi:MAG: DUF4062 domain-containing protein [Dehalococcoidia bacterium]
MTIPRPRVFLSSTIPDFRDLRSALKFWFEELGFEVQASDYPDFEHAPDAEAIEACLTNVRCSDYYVLFIGERLGWYVADQRASVTQLEYRAAYESFCQTQQRPLLVTFVKQSLRARLDANKRRGKELRQIESFLQEVRRVGDPAPAANWTIPFATFRDVIDGLRSVIPAVRSPLATKAVLENLRQELEVNLAVLMWRLEGKSAFRTWYLAKLRESVDLKRGTLGRSYSLDFRQMRDLVVYFSAGMPSGESLVTRALDHALTSGALLEFESSEQRYRSTEVLEQLYMLRREIDGYLSLRVMLDSNFSVRVIEAWDWINVNRDRTVDIRGLDLLTLFAIHDAQTNVQRLMISLLLYVYHGAPLVQPSILHSSPVVDDREAVDQERMDHATLASLLQSKDVLLVSSLRDLTVAERELGTAFREQLRAILGSDRANAILRQLQPEPPISQAEWDQIVALVSHAH